MNRPRDEIAKIASPTPDGRMRLRSPSTQTGVGILLLLFGVFWLGITTGACWDMLRDYRGWSWYYLFPAPFYLAGLVLVILGVYTIVSSVMAARRLMPPVLTVDRMPLRLGDRFRMSFEQQAKQACRIERVVVKLTCQEWARYRHGRDRRTVEHIVHQSEHEIIPAGDVHAMDQLTADVTMQIPVETMHTFDAMDNKISWRIELTTAIASWPDYVALFPLIVSPRMAPDAARSAQPMSPQAEEQDRT